MNSSCPRCRGLVVGETFDQVKCVNCGYRGWTKPYRGQDPRGGAIYSSLLLQEVGHVRRKGVGWKEHR